MGETSFKTLSRQMAGREGMGGSAVLVTIIPHTWDVTTLGRLKVGDPVNLEIDMLARYLARWQETA